MDNIYYQALAAKDSRFDGVFFVGVKSTGIYCRPVCTARLPQQKNCTFFDSSASAEKMYYRPCLKCRPELAPGNAPIDDAERIANQLVSRINDGVFDDETGMEEIAANFNLSSRQIRRIIQNKFGVSPIELLITRRLLLAKQLLTETRLSITDIAFASGFGSLRRFNDAFKKRYGMPPSQLKKQIGSNDSPEKESIKLKLFYRPPYDWVGILEFLALRSIVGVESIDEISYSRTVHLGKHKGWFRVQPDEAKPALDVEIAMSLLPVLPAFLNRIRNIFDLDARPDVMANHLALDPHLKNEVQCNPGLRVPGAFDGFELAVRGILGQQITVKAATTIASRYVKTFGEPIETPFPALNHLSPTPEKVATLTPDDLGVLGIIRTRGYGIITLANQIAKNEISLEANSAPEITMNKLVQIPGIGKWTAHYIAMRALRWTDAFPKEDIVIRNKLGGVTPKQAEEMSQAWRPWRMYATLYLWRKKLDKKT